MWILVTGMVSKVSFSFYEMLFFFSPKGRKNSFKMNYSCFIFSEKRIAVFNND